MADQESIWRFDVDGRQWTAVPPSHQGGQFAVVCDQDCQRRFEVRDVNREALKAMMPQLIRSWQHGYRAGAEAAVMTLSRAHGRDLTQPTSPNEPT